MIQFNANGIPAELKKYKQWVLWKLIKYRGDWQKMPHTYKWDSKKEEYKVKWASTTDPNDWLTFEDALETYSSSKYENTDEHVFDGIGFVFTADDPYVFIDIDDAIDDEGYANDDAEQILDMFNNTWTEISQSGEGLHIICKADKSTLNKIKRNRKSKDKRGKYEIYTSKRFCAMTGDVVGDIVSVTDCSESVLWFYKNYIDTGAVITISAKKKKVPTTADEVIELLRRERSGKFTELFDDGDVADYGGDDSAADMALACKIAFYTQDPDIVEQVFSESALADREKWEDREDYRQGTIEKAIQEVLDSGEWYLSEQQKLEERHNTIRPLDVDEKITGGDPIIFVIDKPFMITKPGEARDKQCIGVGSRGNITSVVANPGWGKTSGVVGGLVSAIAMKYNGADYLPLEHWGYAETNVTDSLGFKVDDSVQRVLVIDTEQDRRDSQRVMHQSVFYRHLYPDDKFPWLTWIPALEYENPHEIWERIKEELYTAHKEGMPYDVVIVDMLADLVTDINNPDECQSLVKEIRRVIQEYDLCFFTTLHPNPKQTNMKPAGWLGSIIHRKSKTVMTITKSDLSKDSAYYEPDDDGNNEPSFRISTSDGIIGKNRGDRQATIYMQYKTVHIGDDKRRMFFATYRPNEEDEYNSEGSRKKKIVLENNVI